MKTYKTGSTTVSEFLAQIGYERGLHALHPSESGHFKAGELQRRAAGASASTCRSATRRRRWMCRAWAASCRTRGGARSCASPCRASSRRCASCGDWTSGSAQRRRVGRIDPEEAAPRRRREHVLQQRRVGFKWGTTHARLRRLTRGAARGRGRHHGAPRRAADAGADAKGHGRVPRIARVVAELGPRGVAGAAALGARRARGRRGAARCEDAACRNAVLACNAADSQLYETYERRFDAEIARRGGDEFRANRRAVVAAPARNAPPFASKYPINCQQPNTGPPERRRWKLLNSCGGGWTNVVRNVKGVRSCDVQVGDGFLWRV